MDDATISAVVSEITPLLVGRRFGKIFQLSPLSLAIDFGLREYGYLFISAEPALPRLYLIKRRVRDLEKQSTTPGPFALFLRKELALATVLSVEKDESERVVRIKFDARDDLGQERQYVFIAQLTGRAANLFLLDRDDFILSAARPGRGPGQGIGENYQPPPAQRRTKDTGVRSPTNRVPRASIPRGVVNMEGNSSEALDTYYLTLETELNFDTQAANARARLRKQISQRRKLLAKLDADLNSHADFAEHKHIGDLLLASVSTAKRAGNRVRLIDYFAEGAPVFEIEIDEKTTLPEEASRRFALYSRSKRAQQQIASRIEQAQSELALLEAQKEELEKIIAERDETALAAIAGSEPVSAGGSGQTRGRRAKKESKIPGVRRYLSSDGFEVLVGRGARDNDNLTFKVARPNDLWLHAADYPGSHVVVRNSTRKDVPHQTIVEAAQLAAYFSQAGKDPKVDVHYTQRKFLSKPKGAAPGLVRMSRFKNVTVQPKELTKRI